MNSTEDNSQRALVMSAEPILRRVLKQLLTQKGMQVTDTDDPALVAGELSSNPPTFMVLDADVPGAAAAALVKMVRDQPALEGMPVIVLGSEDSGPTLQRAMQLGADASLSKPISPFEFLDKVAPWVSGTGRALVASRPDCRILIVDDEKRALLLAASSLYERGGFEVFLAQGGVDGFQRFKEVSPDAIVIGLRMQDLSGAGLLKRIIEVADLSTIKVVFSGDSKDLGDLKALLRLGVRGTLEKPFQAATLPQRVERILGLSASEGRAAGSGDRFASEIQRIVTVPAESA